MSKDVFAYMIVTEKGNPVLSDYRLPIYWLRRLAVADAVLFGGDAGVVRIGIPLVEPLLAQEHQDIQPE